MTFIVRAMALCVIVAGAAHAQQPANSLDSSVARPENHLPAAIQFRCTNIQPPTLQVFHRNRLQQVRCHGLFKLANQWGVVCQGFREQRPKRLLDPEQILFPHRGVHGAELAIVWGTEEREREYYPIVNIPLPKDTVIEAGAFAVLPDRRIAVGTRHGEIYLIDGVDAPKPTP